VKIGKIFAEILPPTALRGKWLPENEANARFDAVTNALPAKPPQPINFLQGAPVTLPILGDVSQARPKDAARWPARRSIA
jgi:hypothetical protein